MSSWRDKTVLSLDSQKKCDVGKHYWFCYILVTWWRCVDARNTWLLNLLILFFIFIFYFCNSFKFTNFNKKILNTTNNHHSSLTVLGGGATKKISHHFHDGNRCSQPSQQKFVVQQPISAVAAAPMGAPLSNNTALFDCYQGQGGGYLACCASHGTARTMRKLKNNI